MNENSPAPLDQAAFQRVWRRVMPTDRPDCPFVLDPPSLPEPIQPLMRPPMTPVSCLGEASMGELPTLEGLLALTVNGYRIYRAMERRMSRGGKGRGLFSTLAAAKKGQVRRLSTARFLIAGQEPVSAPTPAPTAESLSLFLRERFQEEQRAAAEFLSAAQAAVDPCLRELYQVLAAENRSHAAQLRSRLEQM